MAKYYIKSGTFEIILDASDLKSGMQKAASRALKTKSKVGVLAAISETGFGLATSGKIISFIPFLEEVGATLPPRKELLLLLSKVINKPLKDLDNRLKKWYLEGDENFDPEI